MGPLISLIVPVWEDDDLVVDLVNRLPAAPELVEWIVVAVCPGQSLCDLHRRGAIQLISCNEPSRGRQMNAGANAARGTLLCFHHCDTELGREHLSALEKVATDETVVGGAFHRRFRAQRTMWRDPLVRWLSRLGGPLFGDQSIFVKTTVFQKLGGFADIPLMEDLEFSRRLRKFGRVRLLDPPLWSPPRRLGRWGTWWRTLRNATFIGLFYLGVDPHTLHSWYYRRAAPGPSLDTNHSQEKPFERMTVTSNVERSAGQSFPRTLANHGLTLRRTRTEIFQLNVGKLCDLTCIHCHVNAGPKRKEIITRETVDRVLGWLVDAKISTVDLTGGAPEMVPDFRYLVEQLRRMPQIETIIDRCNLTILFEPGFEWLAEFLVAHRLKIVASMPCYGSENVDAQRGDGVFDSSIRALQLLNNFGYGRQSDLSLDLVYNPNGDFLPSAQAELEADYKRELKAHFDIDFHRLYTITNMPIGRFASWLKHNGKLDAYMELLVEAFNPASVAGLMCRNTLSVGWRGEVYDCDFNQQLGMQWKREKPLFLWDLDPEQLSERPIAVGDHCFGCTAGSGSSCSGALVS